MANLTDSDFILFSQLSDINDARSRNSPQLDPIRKNASISKGEISSPQSGDELYAHNFLNVIDCYIAYAFMKFQNAGSSSTMAEISPYVPQFIDMSFSEASGTFISNPLYWTGIEFAHGAWYEPLLKRDQIPDTVVEQGSFARTLNNHWDEYLAVVPNHLGTTTISITKNQNGHLLASDFQSAFSTFCSEIEMVRNGCMMRNHYDVQAESWNTSYSDSPSGSYSPSTPTGNGPFRRIRKNELPDHSITTSTQTSFPIYEHPTRILANAAYVKTSGGVTTILKPVRGNLSFIPIVKLYQKVVDDEAYGNPIIDEKVIFKKVSVDDIGSFYLPTGAPYRIYFTFNPPYLASVVSSLDGILGIDLSSYASGNEYNLYLDSVVEVMFLAYPTNL